MTARNRCKVAERLFVEPDELGPHDDLVERPTIAAWAEPLA
ncbi:hypothetical protein [Nonomuraea sp. NPDC050643]